MNSTNAQKPKYVKPQLPTRNFVYSGGRKLYDYSKSIWAKMNQSKNVKVWDSSHTMISQKAPSRQDLHRIQAKANRFAWLRKLGRA